MYVAGSRGRGRAFARRLLGSVLFVVVVSSCGGSPARADQWLDGLALAGGVHVVGDVNHPRGVDAVEASIDFPSPVGADGVRQALGSPAGYQEMPVGGRATGDGTHPTRGRVKTTQIAGVIVPSGQPSSGCTIGVWGVEPAGGGPDFSGVWLDVACGP